MQIFKLIGNLNIDSSKKTVAFFDKGDQEKYTHIYGAARVIKEHIKNNYNIITIGMGCGLVDNYYEFTRSYSDELLRKVDDKDYKTKNEKQIRKALDNDFKELPHLDYCILGTDDPFRIPLTNYARKKFDKHLYDLQNEYFDYVGESEDVISKINEVNKLVLKDWMGKVSPIAFSTKDNSIPMYLMRFLTEIGKLDKVIAFAIDPSLYEPYFSGNNIKLKQYYFANDNRGTRKYEQLDIAQLQHLVYDVKHGKDRFGFEKTKNMFFAGSLFQDKGNRIKIWEEFLRDFKDESSSYYIPLRKNGGVLRGKENERQIKTLQEQYNKLYSEVINHPCYKQASGPEYKTDIVKEYRYGMIFRCVSYYDSLNFRPVLYSSMGILPLLDYAYDPEYLQIPKNIQDKIVVRSSNDIEQKIKYFNENKNERLKIIEDLRKIFRIDYYLDDPKKAVEEVVKKILE